MNFLRFVCGFLKNAFVTSLHCSKPLMCPFCQLSKVQTPYPDIFEAFGSQMGLKVIDSHVMADNPQWPNETAGQSD